MDDWITPDRSAIQAALAQRNLEGLPLWLVVSIVHAALALVLAVWQHPAQPGVLYFLPLLSVALASAAAVAAWRRPGAVLPVHAPTSVLVVLASSLTVAGVLVAAPAAVAPVAAALMLASLGAALLFSWSLGLAIGVQAGVLATWAGAVALGPGWLADPAQLGAVSLGLVGAAGLGLVVQRHQRLRDAALLERQRELERATAVVDSERQRVRRSGQAKDQLFSDVTNGLREPVVRMLRDIKERAEAQPDRAAELRTLWRDGLRLLRKLDDLGSLALYQRGYLRLRARRVSLVAELERIVAPVQELVRGMGIEIVLVVEGSPEDVHLDTARFERIVLAMLAEALRRCPPDAEIQVELHVDRLATGTPLAQVEVWCDAPEEPIDRGNEDDFWREPEGDRVEQRLARALAELHSGRLTDACTPELLSWKLVMRTGTEHLTDSIIDRRVADRGGGRGRRFEDRQGMTWAYELSESLEYRLLELAVIAEAGASTPEEH